jgi:hypothetical protein
MPVWSEMIALTLVLAAIAGAVFFGLTIFGYRSVGVRMVIALILFIAFELGFFSWIYYAAHQMPEGAEVIVPIPIGQRR